MLEIPCAEASLLVIQAQCYIALFQDHPVMVAQHRQEHATFEVRPNGIPIDIEISREQRILTPFENIEPPGVIAANTHVIGNEIEDQPHTMRMESVNERAELPFRADFRIEPVVINDVVAVGRTWPRLHDRRSINVTDAESREIRHQIRCVAKSELPMELQPVGGANCGEIVGQSTHPLAERWRASSTSLTIPRRSAPLTISSKLRDKRRRQLGWASVVPGRLGCSISDRTSSS